MCVLLCGCTRTSVYRRVMYRDTCVYLCDICRLCVFLSGCMHVCMHACMYVIMYARMYAFMFLRMYARMYICTFVRMHVCMYVCMHEFE